MSACRCVSLTPATKKKYETIQLTRFNIWLDSIGLDWIRVDSLFQNDGSVHWRPGVITFTTKQDKKNFLNSQPNNSWEFQSTQLYESWFAIVKSLAIDDWWLYGNRTGKMHSAKAPTCVANQVSKHIFLILIFVFFESIDSMTAAQKSRSTSALKWNIIITIWNLFESTHTLVALIEDFQILSNRSHSLCVCAQKLVNSHSDGTAFMFSFQMIFSLHRLHDDWLQENMLTSINLLIEIEIEIRKRVSGMYFENDWL